MCALLCKKPPFGHLVRSFCLGPHTTIESKRRGPPASLNRPSRTPQAGAALKVVDDQLSAQPQLPAKDPFCGSSSPGTPQQMPPPAAATPTEQRRSAGTGSAARQCSLPPGHSLVATLDISAQSVFPRPLKTLPLHSLHFLPMFLFSSGGNPTPPSFRASDRP